MKTIVVKPFWTAIFLAGMLIVSAHASTSSLASDGKPETAVKKKKTGASGQVRFLPGSAETTRERSSRLKRECQGQVNAGACAGYTR